MEVPSDASATSKRTETMKEKEMICSGEKDRFAARKQFGMTSAIEIRVDEMIISQSKIFSKKKRLKLFENTEVIECDALLVEKTLSLELEDSCGYAFFNTIFWDKFVCTKVLLILHDWNETAAMLLRKCHDLKFQHYWQAKSRFLNGHSSHRRRVNRNQFRAILVADFYDRHFLGIITFFGSTSEKSEHINGLFFNRYCASISERAVKL